MKLFTTTLFILISLSLLSQPLGPLQPAPFGFVEILAGAGIVYGARMIRKQGKKENVD